MKEQEPNYFAVIDARVRYDDGLTPNAKLLYGEITALCNKKGCCWATNDYFAQLYKTSEKTISRWVKNLEEKGYIATSVQTFRYNDGTVKKVRYIFLDKNGFDHMDKNVQNHMDKNVQNHMDKNVTYNNTIYNNTENNIIERKKESSFEKVFEQKNVDGKLKEAFIELIKSRKLNKKNMTDKALELAINKVRKLESSEDRQVQVIYQSIENGWQGLFPLKEVPQQIDHTAIHRVQDGEDVSWKVVFKLWQKLLGYWVPETEGNVQAAKDLLAAEGERNTELLIASLRMRGEYSFLSRGLKNIGDIAGLWANRVEVWRFYSEHQEEWARWSHQAAMGKKKWQL